MGSSVCCTHGQAAPLRVALTSEQLLSPSHVDDACTRVRACMRACKGLSTAVLDCEIWTTFTVHCTALHHTLLSAETTTHSYTNRSAAWLSQRVACKRAIGEAWAGETATGVNRQAGGLAGMQADRQIERRMRAWPERWCLTRRP